MGATTANYGNQYFGGVVDDCANELLEKSKEEKVFESKEQAEAVLRFATKEQLTGLFKLSGKDFYLTLVTTLGSIRFANKRNKELSAAIDKLKVDTGLEGKTLKDFMKNDKQIMRSLSGENTLKLVIGKVLGILRFTWDTVVLGGGFTIRVTKEFGVNLIECLRKTKDYAVQEAKAVGPEIKASWKRNISPINLDDFIDDDECEEDYLIQDVDVPEEEIEEEEIEEIAEEEIIEEPKEEIKEEIKEEPKEEPKEKPKRGRGKKKTSTTK